MCSNAISLPPAIHASAIATITTPGSTVPIRNPLLVRPEAVAVPLRVTHVAAQYMTIENSPTKTPFCARAGIPIM